MIVGSTYFPAEAAGKYRSQQVKADLQTAVELDHPERHGQKCRICLMREFDEPKIAARLITFEGQLGFCSTLLELFGLEAELTSRDLERFSAVWGAEYPQDSPREEGGEG